MAVHRACLCTRSVEHMQYTLHSHLAFGGQSTGVRELLGIPPYATQKLHKQPVLCWLVDAYNAEEGNKESTSQHKPNNERQALHNVGTVLTQPAVLFQVEAFTRTAELALRPCVTRRAVQCYVFADGFVKPAPLNFIL